MSFDTEKNCLTTANVAPGKVRGIFQYTVSINKGVTAGEYKLSFLCPIF